MIKPTRPVLFILATLLVLTACQKPTEPPLQTDADSQNIKAAVIVNGKIISEQEIKDRVEEGQAQLRRRNPKIIQHMEKAVVQSLVQKELAAQKALELGLDSDPGYLEQMQRITARFNAFKRDRLAELFEAREIQAKALATDADVDKYIAENESSIRSESRIKQLMQRSEEKIKEISNQLASGRTFDEVATELFPELPAEMKRPWDMGYLNWEQIPEAWVETLANLQPGEASGIITGPKNRYWIIQLVDRRVNNSLDMDAQREKIRALLQQEKLNKLREQTMQALQAAATIVYVAPEPGSEPEPEEEPDPELEMKPE